MPKLFIDSLQGTFTAEARAQIAAKLTDLGMVCERLADSPKVRAGVWVFFTEHEADAMFNGGEIASTPLIRLLALTLEGGMDAASKQKFIADGTAILSKHAASPGNQVTVYVVIREVPEINWGMNGKQVSLAALRAAV